jgi:hypothetical protein
MGLWNEKLRNEYAISRNLAPEILKWRRSGRSTRIALITIARCYEMRGSWVDIVDHYDTPKSNLYLFDTIFNMVKDLKFEGFEFNRLDMKVRLLL